MIKLSIEMYNLLVKKNWANISQIINNNKINFLIFSNKSLSIDVPKKNTWKNKNKLEKTPRIVNLFIFLFQESH